MEWAGRTGERGKRGLALAMAVILWTAGAFASLPPRSFARAAEKTVEAWGEGWHYYCIDGFGYAANGVCTNGDRYRLVSPSSELNGEEQAILFWAFLSFQAGKGNSQAAGYVHAVNERAGEEGLAEIRSLVTEEDLKGVIHSDRVRDRYPWLMEAVNRGEDYLKAAGLLGGSYGSGIPEALKEAKTLVSAVSFTKEGDGGWSLSFGESKETQEFLAKTPIELSLDGENWSAGSVGGWLLERRSDGLRLFHPDPQAPVVFVRFRPEGAETGFSTPEECYESSIQLVKCVECSGTHIAGGRLHPLEEHQRNMDLEIPLGDACFYGRAGGSGSPDTGALDGGDGPGWEFKVYRHEEILKADYRVQLYKYDYETGQPLEGATFLLYERPENSDGTEEFRLVTSVITDSRGHASYNTEKEYLYEKTFCDGHPAVRLAELPEEEINEETGEILNQTVIDQVMAANTEAEAAWEACVEACEEMAEGGDHFHWMMEEDSFESADGDRAYEASGCREDCEQTYQKWISRRYSYTFVEKTARDGYIRHGQHPEDIPIEIITTDSSQNGANSVFEGGYSGELKGTGAIAEAEENVGEALRERPELSAMPGEGLSFDGTELYGKELSFWNVPKIRKTSVSMRKLLGLMEATPAEGAERATPGKAGRKATPGAAVEKVPKKAAILRLPFVAASVEEVREISEGSDVFSAAFQDAFHSASAGPFVEPGPDGNFSHCNDQDREGNAWRIYDHRTEGQIHMNKKDKELAEGETEDYDGYGDTQGDGTLKGAVYGLFAAEPLVHPDGKTGIVFQQNDLVSVAVTDANGDASFLTITEGPGYTYDYQKREIVKRNTGWADKAPGNLYRGQEFDDYSEDGAYKRVYPDLQTENGNCWAGRPLLLGSYYVKELSRSEGYELSVNGSQDPISNYGYSLEVTIPEGRGSVSVLRAPYVEPQSSGTDEDTMGNVIHFETQSRSRGADGYDLVFEGYPKGSCLYRKDTSLQSHQVEIPTGKKEKRYLYDETGQPVYQRADAENTYPKRNPDGSFMTEEVAVSAVVSSMGEAKLRKPDMELSLEILNKGSHPETGISDREKNEEELLFSGEGSEDFLYMKKKVEEILRANGYQTPKEDGAYSDYEKGVFDRGLRGEEPVFGAPVLEISVKKRDREGNPIRLGDGILTLVDAYSDMPFYDYGGIDGWRETEEAYLFSVYAGVYGNPEHFLVPDDEPVIYRRVSYLPDEERKDPRYLYVPYSNGMDGAFGNVKDLKAWETSWEQDGEILRENRYSAVLSYDALVDGAGVVRTRTVTANVYYKTGEILLDEKGQPIQDYEWVDVTEHVTQEGQVFRWTEIPVNEKEGRLIAHVEGHYTDAYGVYHEEENKDHIWKLVLPQETAVLKNEDVKKLPPGYGAQEGDRIGMGDYVLYVTKGILRVMPDYEDQSLTGDGLYVKEVRLTYPGQDFVFQDGCAAPGEGTQKEPVGVRQRIIKEKVKVTKTVEGSSEPLGNFRFKAYLKSNLEELWRDLEGSVVWQNCRGDEVDIRERKEQYPGLVPPIYTKKEKGFSPILDEDGWDKFFDAMAVANHDKWDDDAAVSTSYRPIGNRWNRRQETVENAEHSDGVRQFAIDWYLEKEIKNQKAISSRYEDEQYDCALFEAIKQAEDYLKPFFKYDLDDIYAIPWDGEEGGGKDGDGTTLSADRLFYGEQGNYAYGISEYLPYGTYMVVEQQPRYAAFSDLKNRHYKIDKPKEVVIPVLYEDGEVHQDLEWSVKEPKNPAEDKNSQAAEENRLGYRGFSYGEYHNRLLQVHLRLEKLDSETHENILHDEAVFQLYKAQRDEGEQGTGKVLRYEEATLVAGSREFLEDMRAENITPAARKEEELSEEEKQRYTGIVAAGTPVCKEADRLPWTISTGRTGDGKDQNAGYGEFSEPVPAGAYVICERKPPAGYERSRPAAVEIYSDQVTYDREGDPEQEAAAARFSYPGKTDEEAVEWVRIFMEDRPLKAVIEKKKKDGETVTFRLGTRLDGTYGEIGGRSDYEYAWKNGQYLGYGWKKGTLEYLNWLKEQGKEVEIVYQDGVFAGYGYVTEKRETSDDENPYIAGALMALYEGAELIFSGDSQDYTYENLVVRRDWTNQVTEMYVKAGNGRTDNKDILYYDLSGLEVTFRKKLGDELRLYGYDRDHGKVDILQLQSDKEVYENAASECSVFAFRDGAPYLEFAGGDLTKLGYERISKTLTGDFALPQRDRYGNVTFGEGTRVYHLDRKGNRDSLVDPDTGMAYVTRETKGAGGKDHEKVIAWAVSENGNKIATSRTASFGTQGEIYQNGTWGSEPESHRETTLKVNGQGLPLYGEPRIPLHNGNFEKTVDTVIDQYGLPVYYPREELVYEQMLTLYDRDGDVVEDAASDHVKAYGQASYEIPQSPETGSRLYHRRGERYLLPNIWKSGAERPDFPFAQSLTDGQADVLTRIPAGTYILEELDAPTGYVKGLPKGLIVKETPEKSGVVLEDDTVKLFLSKLDSTDSYEKTIRIMNGKTEQSFGETRTEERSAYTHGPVAGAELALYQAKRVYTEDRDRYPKGYYLEKTDDEPLRYLSTNSRESQKEMLEARWMTDGKPVYLEGIPAGLYLLEELRTPEGFLPCAPMEVEIREGGQVQSIIINNDHTRIEVEKYAEEEGKRIQVEGAKLTLYKALTDEQGNIRYENGRPCYDPEKKLDSWISGKRGRFAGFMGAFEEMYQIYGTAGRMVGWQKDGEEQKAVYVSHTQIDDLKDTAFPSMARMVFRTSDGMDICISIYERKDNRQGKDFTFEYQFDYRTLPQVNGFAASYETTDGIRRFDYLPVGLPCVLVETQVPEGYEGGEAIAFMVQESSEIQRYLMENKGRRFFISKTEEGKEEELSGARLALYRADETGALRMEPEYFVEEWISGRDGIYTDADEVHGRIPEGYRPGDKKPHEIGCLPYGIYYLTEWESPEGYEPFAPIPFVYEESEEIQLVRVTNRPEKPEEPTPPETTEPTEPPTEPETPEESGTEPEEPTEPESSPEEPSEPETPEESETEPEEPTEPESSPEEPSEPETPEESETEPEEPTEPESLPKEPLEPVTPGKIRASYSGRFLGDRFTGTFGNIRIPQTGDGGAARYVLLLLISLAGFGTLFMIGRRKEHNEK